LSKAYRTINALNLHAVIGPYDPEISLATESLKIPYLCTTTVGRLQRFQYTVQVRSLHFYSIFLCIEECDLIGKKITFRYLMEGIFSLGSEIKILTPTRRGVCSMQVAFKIIWSHRRASRITPEIEHLE
jgi:hypothetical protein